MQIQPYSKALQNTGLYKAPTTGAVSRDTEKTSIMKVQRLLGWTILFASYDLEKEESTSKSVAQKTVSRPEGSWGKRDRLKKVSNHEIPVLTPQLLKEKIAQRPQKCTTILAVSREMLRV